jgi:hypothetical protein
VIGIDRALIPGVYASGSFGLAVLRWSASQACLDAVELSVRDERHEVDVGIYEAPGTLRKLIGSFGPATPTTTASTAKTSAPTSKADPRKGDPQPPKPPGPPMPRAAGNATLALILHGAELRQRLQCSGIAP